MVSTKHFSIVAGITAVLGLVIADGRHGNTAHLMHEADMACYEAKRGGRNRVVVADPSWDPMPAVQSGSP